MITWGHEQQAAGVWSWRMFLDAWPYGYRVTTTATAATTMMKCVFAHARVAQHFKGGGRRNLQASKHRPSHLMMGSPPELAPAPLLPVMPTMAPRDRIRCMLCLHAMHLMTSHKCRLSVRRAISFFLDNLQRQLEREETLGVRSSMTGAVRAPGAVRVGVLCMHEIPC